MINYINKKRILLNIKNKIKLNITLYNNVNLNENIEKLTEIENINKQIKNKIK